MSQSDLFGAAQPQFFPIRLTLARELRGLTKRELAKRVEKSAAAVGQFEIGKTRPDRQTIRRLALALSVTPAFFARPTQNSRVEVDDCHFRSLRTATQRDRRKLLATGTLVRELVALLEEHVEFPEERVSEVAAAVTTDEEIEQCAVAVRRAWGLGLGPIPNMVRLLETRGVVVCCVSEDVKKVDAFSFWYDSRPAVFLVMEKNSTSRTRHDAAHELGHLVMHADVSPGNVKLERQADRFASAFLMPRETFARECPSRINWAHLYELKRRWRTSVASIIYRGWSLGIISDASRTRAFVHLNKTGQRRNEKYEPPPEPPELIPKSVQLLTAAWTTPKVARALAMGDSDFKGLLRMLRGVWDQSKLNA